MVLDYKRDIKDLKRFKQILGVFLEEGLGYYVSKSKLMSHLPFLKRFKLNLRAPNKKKQAYCLRHAFEKLGPSFIKLGQLLSLRPDLVPREYCDEFEKLQDNVPQFSYKKTKEIIEQDLNKPLNKLFKSFDKKPIACASISQVHVATTKQNKKVAVKVRRPDIENIINLDLDILFFIANQLEKHLKGVKKYQLVEIVKEFATWTLREINFVNEANNAIKLKQALKENKNVFVPKVYQSLSSQKVLTTQYIDGFKISDFSKLTRSQRKRLGEIYFQTILDQALLYGYFHADPHPANIFVYKNKLAFLDFGIMGNLSEKDRYNVIKFIRSLKDKDSEKSFKIALLLAKQSNESNYDHFKKQAIPILESVYMNDINSEKIGLAFYKIISLGARNGYNFDPNHVLMAKAIYQAEGLGMKLNPNFKIREGLDIFAKKCISIQLKPQKILKNLKSQIIDNATLLLELPEHIRNIIDKLENQDKQNQNEKTIKKLEAKITLQQEKNKFNLILITIIVAILAIIYFQTKTQQFNTLKTYIILLIAIIITIYIKKRGN